MKRRNVTAVALTILAVTVLFAAGLCTLSWSARRPSNLGVRDGRLASCPETPNCVSTQADDQVHWIAPVEVADHLADPVALVAEIIASMPGGSVIEQRNDYLRAEFCSALFRFRDDVEFLLEADGRRLHFRSASRVGHSDLGVNRARMEEFRRRWKSALNASPSAGLRLGARH